jgi:dimethylamine monooxygenase subunit A
MSTAAAPLLGRYMPYPFADGDYSLSLGLVPMREESWLDFDDKYVAEMAEKARRLRYEHDMVFRALRGTEPGQREVLELLLEHLSACYPQYFRFSSLSYGGRSDATGRIENVLNGDVWNIADFCHAPLDLAARLIQEDLCLMSPDGKGTYLLTAASVCFPLRWELTDKIGLPMAGIHQPVPDYDEKLAAPADRYMLGLKEHKPSWRCNWSIVNAPDLYLKQRRHKQDRDTEITAENAGRKLWIRSERQTLRKLLRSGDVLFTIRTYIKPLSVLEEFPSVARGLSQAIGKMPPRMRSYKNLLPISDALLAYLDRVGG